jgi:hypothetical protein
MSIEAYDTSDPLEEKPPVLSLVESQLQSQEPNVDIFDHYLSAREETKAGETVDPALLEEIQTSVRDWIETEGLIDAKPSYANFDREAVDRRLGKKGLVEFLSTNYGDVIPKNDLDTTLLFIDTVFLMYEQGQQAEETPTSLADSTFTFMVPARTGRNYPEYGKETESVIPALKYVPHELKTQMMVNLPPFAIDKYIPNEFGLKGYLVLAPIYEDILHDYKDDPAELGRIIMHNVNATVDFAYKSLKSILIGEGAILPRITNYGKTINNPNVITTTGHGGTIQAAKYQIEEVVERKLVKIDPESDKPLKVGVLGLGAMGLPFADVLADYFPDYEFVVFDSRQEKIDEAEATLKKYGSRMQTAKSAKELIESSNIIVSAVTRKVDLSDMGPDSLEGKVIIDDSQPGAFDPEAVKARSGMLAWVICRGRGKSPLIKRNDYDYATMHNATDDLFPCEAEVASLAARLKALSEQGLSDEIVRHLVGDLAIRDAVTSEASRRIGELFEECGIGPAPFQAFGELVVLPEQNV